jgi:hypothetical protein
VGCPCSYETAGSDRPASAQRPRPPGDFGGAKRYPMNRDFESDDNLQKSL